MLRSIYRVASSGSSSKDAFSTLFHAGLVKVVRCMGDNSLECFELEVRGGSSIALRSHVVPLGHAGLEEQPVLFAVHCFTQRLGPSQPLPVMGVLAVTEEAHFSVRICGGRLRCEGTLSEMAADCQTLPLDFVPSLLKSLLLPPALAAGGGWLPAAFLVSGSCRELRVLAQRAASGLFEWLPDTAALPALPPSFAGCRTQALCADVRHVPGLGEVAAFGCEDGCVLLTVDGTERQRVHLDGPVSSVCLFSPAPRRAGRSPRQQLWADRPLLPWSAPDEPPPGSHWDWEGLASAVPRASAAAAALARFKAAAAAAEAAQPAAAAALHLACGGAAGFVVVFEHVATAGLERCAVLAAAEDTVLSMAAGDWDADGREELLVGTHGGRLLAFGAAEGGGWTLKSAMDFGPPLHSFHALRHVDVVPYVLCGTPGSLEVLGPPLRALERLLQDRLDILAPQFAQ